VGLGRRPGRGLARVEAAEQLHRRARSGSIGSPRWAITHVRQIVDLATTGRLPSFGFPELIRANGLLAFRGTPTSELPIEQPANFELVIN
jgi:hypothetical protein